MPPASHSVSAPSQVRSICDHPLALYNRITAVNYIEDLT